MRPLIGAVSHLPWKWPPRLAAVTHGDLPGQGHRATAAPTFFLLFLPGLARRFFRKKDCLWPSSAPLRPLAGRAGFGVRLGPKPWREIAVTAAIGAAAPRQETTP